MDLEAFSTKQLYSKLADQSHHVVATIGGQKEEVSLIIIIMYIHSHRRAVHYKLYIDLKRKQNTLVCV